MGARGAAVLLAACTLAGCTPHEQQARRQAGSLKTGIRPVRVADASFRGLTLLLDVEFDNASAAALSVRSITYRVSLATRPWTQHEPWAKGEAGQGVAVEPRSATVVTVPVAVPFGRLCKLLPLAATDPQIGYIVRAEVHLDAGGGQAVTVPLRGQGIVAVPIVPTVSLSRLEAERLDAEAARLALIVRVTNRNAFQATVRQLKGDVSLAGKRVAAIDLAPNSALAPGGSAELAAPLDLDFRRLGADLHAVLAAGTVDVRLEGSARVLTPHGESTVPIRLTRPLRVRR